MYYSNIQMRLQAILHMCRHTIGEMVKARCPQSQWVRRRMHFPASLAVILAISQGAGQWKNGKKEWELLGVLAITLPAWTWMPSPLCHDAGGHVWGWWLHYMWGDWIPELCHSEEPKRAVQPPSDSGWGKQIFILLRHRDMEIVTAASVIILTPASSFREV